MITAGVRAAFVASQHAARLMAPARGWLIANVSHWATQKHVGNLMIGFIATPTVPGPYTVKVDLVDEEVTWFEPQDRRRSRFHYWSYLDASRPVSVRSRIRSHYWASRRPGWQGARREHTGSI